MVTIASRPVLIPLAIGAPPLTVANRLPAGSQPPGTGHRSRYAVPNPALTSTHCIRTAHFPRCDIATLQSRQKPLQSRLIVPNQGISRQT